MIKLNVRVGLLGYGLRAWLVLGLFMTLGLAGAGRAQAQSTVSQNFDGAAAPARPSDWVYSDSNIITYSYDGGGAGAFTSTPNILVFGPANAVNTAFYNALDTNGGNVVVQGTLKLNSVGAEAFLIGRATTTNWATLGGYTLDIQEAGTTAPDVGVAICRKQPGGSYSTISSRVAPSAIVANAYYPCKLILSGSNLSGEVQRASDGFYLTPGGTWQASEIACVNATDSTYPSAGYAGVGDYTSNSSGLALSLDNFLLSSVGGALQTPLLTGTAGVNSASLSASAAGGTAPKTYAFYRSTTSGFTPASGNLVQSSTASTLSDTGLSPNTTYYYVVRVTDSAGTPATMTSTQLSLATSHAAGTFYLAATGSDANPGTQSQPWLTFNHPVASGDKFLLRGGDVFVGPLVVNGVSSFSAGSYGTGTATITQGNGDGITVTNSGNVTITSLAFTSTDNGDQTVPHPSTGAAVHWLNTQASGTLSGLKVTGCTVVGGRFGVFVDSENTANGAPFLGWSITHCDISRVHFGGVATFALSANPLGWQQGGPITSDGTFPDSGFGYIIKGGYIADCNFHDIFGNGITTARNDPHAFQTGNWGTAMEFLNADGVLVERCKWDNCGYPGDGTIEVAACQAEASRNITVRYCEASHTHSLDGVDSGAFDLFDGGTQNNTIEYCYTHDNDGPAVEGGSTGRDGVSTGHIVRFNLSVNDCRASEAGKQEQGSIFVFGNAGTWQVYNNTIYLGGTAGNTKKRHGIWIAGTMGAGSLFANNIISVTGNGDALGTNQTNSNLPQIVGNDYWHFGGTAFNITTASGSYSSLAAWQGVSESLLGAPTGYAVDPLLVNPTVVPSGVLSAAPVSSITGFDLQTASPLRGAGLLLGQALSLKLGPLDYHGRLLNFDAYDVGAAQFSAFGGTSTTPAPLINTLTITRTKNSLGQNVFTWTADPLALSYKLVRSVNGATYTVFGTAPAGVTTFTETDRPAVADVRYSIIAVHAQ